MGRFYTHLAVIVVAGLVIGWVFGPARALVAIATVELVVLAVALGTVVIDAHLADRERVAVGEPRHPGCRHVCDLTCSRSRTVTR